MDKARWARIRDAFLHLSDRSPSFRDHYLDMVAEGDTGFRSEIEAMLVAHDEMANDEMASREPPASVTGRRPDAALVGTEQRGYRIIEIIGSGGTSVVYRARHPDQGEVAIKALPRYLLAHAAARARLNREAAVLGALSHPALCGIHEVLDADPLFAIVMEYIDGQDLGKTLDGDILPLSQTLAIAVDLADVLTLAHAHGVVHRDIKPSNVLLTRTGHTKLIDFGIAHFDDARMTYTGELLGSPAYMAPEQWAGAAVDERTDVWSLGALLYLMCCGSPPYRGTTIADYARLVCSTPPAPWPRPIRQQKARREAQIKIRDLALRMLATEPQRRPATMGAVRSELESLRRCR